MKCFASSLVAGALLLPIALGSFVWADSEEQTDASPVSRVVTLLTDIKAELEAEASGDSGTYDQQACWCKTSEEEKTGAISSADSKASDLESEIGSRSAQSGTFGAQIAELEKQVAADKAALEEGTQKREKEASDFTKAEKEMIDDISNLKQAITILSKHYELLQGDGSPLSTSLRTVLRDISIRYDVMKARAAAGLSPLGHKLGVGVASLGHLAFVDVKTHNASADGATLLSILGRGEGSSMPLDIAAKELRDSARQEPRASSTFLQSSRQLPASPTHLEKYSTQSVQIYGIMNQMLETFESDLSKMQEEEATAREVFQAIAKSKTEQIQLGTEHLDQVQAAQADNSQALSDAKTELTLTRETRSADVEYLSDIRLTCQTLDSDWATRSATRSEEIAAVSEALAILKEDDNREHLVKSVSFLQFDADSAMHARSNVGSAAGERAMRSMAAAAIWRLAEKPGMDMSDLLEAWRGEADGGDLTLGSHRNKMAALAMSAELDDFTEVKAAIDKMVSDLQAEQQEEIEFKDNCTADMNSNDKATFTKNEEKEDLEAVIESLDSKIKMLDSDIAASHASMDATEAGLKEAGEAREKENHEFQVTISDQRGAQDILTQALKRLEVFYKAEPAEASMVQKAALEQPPSVQFHDYKNNGGAPAVMTLFEKIIEDSKTLEKETSVAEAEAQASYEAFAKSSSTTMAELEASILLHTKELAEAKKEKHFKETDLAGAMGELDSLAEYKADLHGQCDFLLKNFEVRQQARTEEINALQNAKAFLSGA